MPQTATDGYEVCTQIPPVLYTKGPVLKFKQEHNENIPQYAHHQLHSCMKEVSMHTVKGKGLF